MTKNQILYEIRQHPNVRKQLKPISSKFRLRIQQKIERLGQEPRPKTCEKLQMMNAYRLRVGDYRIIYQVDDRNRIVTVEAVLPRDKSYR